MEWLANLAWYWWIAIGVGVILIGALKLKVWKAMFSKKRGRIE